jgi:signal transduction histidine kinase
MHDNDLYVRHQALVALVGVLMHDLRNPLHNATLLIEAKSLDSEALRTKLRAQFAKLEALLGEATDAVREMMIEARTEEVALDELVRRAIEMASDANCRWATGPVPTGIVVAGDKAMLARAVAELATYIAERARDAPGESETPSIRIGFEQPEPGFVTAQIGDLPATLDEAMSKAPFSIAGGGLHLALARALSQNAGAKMKLAKAADGRSYFTLTAPIKA